MTEILNKLAASDYLRLTLFSFESGLIGRTHFEARLNFLRNNAPSGYGSAQFASDLLGENLTDEETPQVDERRNEVNLSDAQVAADTYWDETDDFLAFRITSGTLKGWEFHQADDDFFPSIPHGHENGRKQPKLDAYLGWVYQKHEQIRRVDRTSIVLLWNNKDFRDFARIAIDYYLDHFPAYRWNNTNPRVLPRIRRGHRYR